MVCLSAVPLAACVHCSVRLSTYHLCPRVPQVCEGAGAAQPAARAARGGEARPPVPARRRGREAVDLGEDAAGDVGRVRHQPARRPDAAEEEQVAAERDGQPLAAPDERAADGRWPGRCRTPARRRLHEPDGRATRGLAGAARRNRRAQTAPTHVGGRTAGERGGAAGRDARGGRRRERGGAVSPMFLV